VHRIHEYIDTEDEGPLHIPGAVVPGWPRHGKIQFDNVYLSYDRAAQMKACSAMRGRNLKRLRQSSGDAAGEDGDGDADGDEVPVTQPLLAAAAVDGIPEENDASTADDTREEKNVLRGLDFTINAGEKIGVCGRTGAGKSSITNVLFRLVAPTSGRVLVDDVDINTVGVHDLRRTGLSIIAQDPILFSGTIRSNLDPFNEARGDHNIWKALDVVKLTKFVKRLPGQLDAVVEANGGNFSLGQRQLLCLSRAILKPTNILCVDEGTANVDNETDALVQSVMRSRFAKTTVLTIAHRLNTIMQSDRVMVIEAGVVVEMDTPAALLANPDGYFFSMVYANGK
jgi:ABC-type multidrug transport system fused ATPase/permease subunit